MSWYINGKDGTGLTIPVPTSTQLTTEGYPHMAWLEMQGIIIDLYQNHTLKDVISILEVAYSFKVSESMLNHRLSEWKAWKKNTKEKKEKKKRKEKGSTVSTTPRNIRPRTTSDTSPPYLLPPPDAFKRQEYALDFVEHIVNFEFHHGDKEAAQFDLVWLTPGTDYNTSWQKLSQNSGELPEFAEAGKMVEFWNVVSKIFNGIIPALQGGKEVTLLVNLWRICRNFRDEKVVDQDCMLIYRLFGVLLQARRKLGHTLERDPLMRLCVCVLNCPLDEIHEILRQCYRRSIDCLKARFDPYNFTTLQMTTDYLMNWDETPGYFLTLVTDFQALIAYTEIKYSSQSWRTITCQHQFLHYTFQCKKDMRLSVNTAKELYPTALRILSTAPTITWDSVTRALLLAAKVLINWCSGEAVGEAFQYIQNVYEILARGNETCRSQAAIFSGEWGTREDMSLVE